MKIGWRDAHVATWDLAEAIFQNIIYKKQIAFNGLSSKFNRSLGELALRKNLKF